MLPQPGWPCCWMVLTKHGPFVKTCPMQPRRLSLPLGSFHRLPLADQLPHQVYFLPDQCPDEDTLGGTRSQGYPNQPHPSSNPQTFPCCPNRPHYPSRAGSPKSMVRSSPQKTPSAQTTQFGLGALLSNPCAPPRWPSARLGAGPPAAPMYTAPGPHLLPGHHLSAQPTPPSTAQHPG